MSNYPFSSLFLLDSIILLKFNLLNVWKKHMSRSDLLIFPSLHWNQKLCQRFFSNISQIKVSICIKFLKCISYVVSMGARERKRMKQETEYEKEILFQSWVTVVFFSFISYVFHMYFLLFFKPTKQKIS